MAIDIGIETRARKKVAGALGQAPGDTCGLYLKASADVMTQRVAMAEKTACMLRAMANQRLA